MKKFTWFMFILNLLLIGSIQMVFADSTAFNLTITDRGTAVSLMQRTASSFFAVHVNNVRDYQSAADPERIFPVFYLASETHSAPQTVWDRKQGHGWGRTCQDMGISPNSHGKYMSARHHRRYQSVSDMDDQDYEEIMTVRFFNDYYGRDPEFVYFWRSKGLSYEDLFVGINLGASLHREPRDFFQLRLAGHNWGFIARQYHVPYNMLSEPAPPVRRYLYNTEYTQQRQNQDDQGENRERPRHGRKHWEDD
jgi:hypothetical protein